MNYSFVPVIIAWGLKLKDFKIIFLVNWPGQVTGIERRNLGKWQKSKRALCWYEQRILRIVRAQQGQ